MSATDVLEQALSLSEPERLQLAERLFASIDSEPSTDTEFDLDPAYEAELQRRFDEMKVLSESQINEIARRQQKHRNGEGGSIDFQHSLPRLHDSLANRERS